MGVKQIKEPSMELLNQMLLKKKAGRKEVAHGTSCAVSVVF